MANFYFPSFVLAAGLASTYPALAQRPPVYQPIGSISDDKYPASLTEPLVILLPVPMSEKSLSKEYKAPADRAGYLADIAARRTALEAAAKSWRLSPVAFKAETAYDSLKADRQAPHLVLYFDYQDVAASNATSVALLPALRLDIVGKLAPTGGLIKRAYEVQPLAYQIFNPNTKLILAGRSPFWQTVFHTSDLIGTVQQMQAFVSQRAQGQKPRDIIRAAEEKLGQNAGLLKSKTLLLAQTQVSPRLPESKLRELYPFPVQLADQAAVDAAAAAADPRYLYLRFVTTDRERGFQLLDAASGQLVGYSSYSAIRADSFGRALESDFAEIVKTATKK